MLNRIVTSVLAVACIALTFALTRAGGAPDGTPLPATAPAAEASATTHPSGDDEAVLNQRLKEVRFDNVRLDEAVYTIGDLTKASIFVNWVSLEGAGIDRAVPVKLHLWNVTLRGALNVLIADVGGATFRLAYTVTDGIITITTAEDASRATFTEIYNIRDMLDEMMENSAAHEVKNGAGSGTKITYQECTDMLVKLITDTVAPDSWRDAGGTIGSIREIAGLLVITEMRENLNATTDLLLRIRDAMHRHELLPATRPVQGR